jgi:hypothetical protein
MIPQDLSESSLLSALDGASIVYFDGRLYETALVVAREVITYILLSILMLTIRAQSYLESSMQDLIKETLKYSI